MKRRFWIPFLLGGAAASLPGTMVERLTLEELTARSERIVHGRCGRTWSAWDDQHQNIWTHCEVQVLDPLKGGALSTVTVSEPGGVVDGMEMQIEGAPRPRAGEEVVLFLYRVPNGMWRSRGLGQGRYRVSRDAETGEAAVQADLEGVTLVEPRTPPRAGATELRRLNGVRLEDFKAAVRRAMLQPRGAGER